MRLLKKLKKGIRKHLRLEIRSRVGPIQIPNEGKGEGNLNIAFIGPAGCGKSTLRRYYLKHIARESKKHIITYRTLKAYSKSLANKLDIPRKTKSTALHSLFY